MPIIIIAAAGLFSCSNAMILFLMVAQKPAMQKLQV